MIVLITPAEGNGGILQFSLEMIKTLSSITEAVLFVPNSARSDINEDKAKNLLFYEKVKTVNPYNHKVMDLAEVILSHKPELVISMEDSVLMQQLIWHLSKKTRTAFVVHDVTAHPYYKMPMRRMIVEYLRRLYTKVTIHKANGIIVLSKNSVNGFVKRYPAAAKKITDFPLGAHVPECAPEKPEEIPDELIEYNLFFGRIDKYKGIDRLVAAYALDPEYRTPLIIAGKGELPDELLDKIKKDDRIILLRRFISDAEMLYLFKKSRCIALPYIEVSQSGVLPIAYKFQKPVVASNLGGLTENMIVGKTGLVFENEQELLDSLKQVTKVCSVDDIVQYFENKYAWATNLKRVIAELFSNDRAK